MRLLFVIKTLALSGGGAERVLADVTTGLADRGYDVMVASFDGPEAKDFYEFDHRVRRLRLGIGQTEKRSDVATTLARIRRLRQLALQERPDVALGFMHSAYIPLALALAGSRLPVVASEHTVFDHYNGRRSERLLLRLTAPLIRQFTAISSSVRAGFPKPVRRKMSIVSNPVRGYGTGSAIAKSPETIVAVGRLEEEKDHQTLIAAFARVAPQFPEWRLRIVGEGTLRSRLQSQVEALDLEDRVELPGAIANIGPVYDAASIVAVPSRYESFGIVTAEAMAHAVPVIGFADCPGTNELIVDEVNGLLVHGDDRVGAMSDGLARLMRSSDFRTQLGSAGPQRAALFAPEKVLDRWEQLLKAVRDRRAVP